MHVRVGPEDALKIDSLISKLPMLNRSAVARASMQLGLELLEKDPQRILARPSSVRTRSK